MYHSRTYRQDADVAYIATPGVIADNVVVVDRNGVGVKHAANFASGTTTVNVLTFNWFGVKRVGLASGEYMNVISTILTSTRTTVYEIGATVTTGRTYSVSYGNQIAFYTAIAGDDATDVRDGIKSAIDAVSWTGYTVTTSSVSTNKLSVVISNSGVDFRVYIGSKKYKKGYITEISSINYIIYEETATSPITLPSLSISYAFGDLTAVPSTVQAYVYEPLTAITYTETASGTTDIYGIASSGNVPDGQCVISEPEQRIYFDAVMSIGEIIKVFSK